VPKPNILIAEDDPVLREVYVRKLARTGCALRTAGDGESAVRMIREAAPDLLVCDITMPTRDGWWVLGQFPKEKRSFPIIMLTNVADDATRERCRRLADGYFVKKDMTLASLAETVRSLLTKLPPA
jgi:CheY-like chemotaxis protein